ncbi:MAG: hypothetical protein HFI89_12785 [Lachnospiraceae bacterium]|nr:hypothetical protein [Lachnospiraceae bacterium]
MSVYYDIIVTTSNGCRPTYHNIAKQVREIIQKSGISVGICVVRSQRTTCSVGLIYFIDWD